MKKDGYKIVFKDFLAAKSIVIKEVVSSRIIDSNLEKKCKDKWKTMIIDAKQKGKKLWDSDVYRFESGEIKNGILYLKVSTVPFSIRFPMNFYTEQLENLGANYGSMGMFTSCFVKTLDNKFIFIEKSGKYYSNKKVSFVGGVLSKTEKILLNGKDLFNEVLKEVREEIGISGVDIDKKIFRCIYITNDKNVCLIFDIFLNKAFNELKNKFSIKNDGEAKELIGITEFEFKNFIKKIDKKDAVKFSVMNFI